MSKEAEATDGEVGPTAKGQIMKGAVVVFILCCIGLFLFSQFLGSQAMNDPGRLFPVGFTPPQGGRVYMHVGVPPGVPIKDPPEFSPTRGLLWGEWLEAHYQLLDASGTKVMLRKIGTSGMFLNQQTAGSPDFVLEANLEATKAYKLVFRPITAEPQRYCYAFTAPSEETKVGIRTFERMQEGE